MSETVWILIVQNRIDRINGNPCHNFLSVYQSKNGALDELLEYVEVCWGKREQTAGKTMPTDRHQAIDCFFDTVDTDLYSLSERGILP